MKISFAALAALLMFRGLPAAAQLRIEKLVIIQPKLATPVEKATAALLSSEISKRTGINYPVVSEDWSADGDAIIIKLPLQRMNLPVAIPGQPALQSKPESFRIVSTNSGRRRYIIIEGADDRGVLFGAGKLLRMMSYSRGAVSFNDAPNLSSAPDKAIRGHQLGYRNTANSYDGWTKEQFEQYIKDLAVFGNNSIESIPIFDESTSSHFKYPPMEMNDFISSVCKKYGLDYWMWIPAQFDLTDTAKRRKYLRTFETICRQSAAIKGVFFPGGDPGDNPPQTVMPLLSDLYIILKKYHPGGKVWLSLQGYSPAQNEFVYRYIRAQKPVWLGGLVTGPSSPTAKETRPELPAEYQIRHYPDVTHNVRCEFEIPWWDPAFSFTLGREAVNPRPFHYSAIFHQMAPYIDGFISYSDGIHDDVNKIVWSELAWDMKADERSIVRDYSNYFFGSDVAGEAADGILALEKNWQGPIIANGGISSTRQLWLDLQRGNPSLDSNWRWQMNLLRACYDDYVRRKLIYETSVEQRVDTLLAQATDPVVAIQGARNMLNAPPTDSLLLSMRTEIVTLCEKLYRSIELQTSVKKYQASGLERGAVLDFVDRPLNNKWWLEDEFTRIDSLPADAKIKALRTIASWEDPGPGGAYDQVGNVGRSPHEMKGESWMMDPTLRKSGNPGYDFSDNGMSRKRLSWLTYMRWPLAMEYNDIDTAARYMIRLSGIGESLLKINGQRVAPARYGRTYSELKEYPVPASLVKSGKLVLTWDEIDEDFLNWRKQSRICEVWLIKNP